MGATVYIAGMAWVDLGQSEAGLADAVVVATAEDHSVHGGEQAGWAAGEPSRAPGAAPYAAGAYLIIDLSRADPALSFRLPVRCRLTGR
jgi:hypothetical protein